MTNLDQKLRELIQKILHQCKKCKGNPLKQKTTFSEKNGGCYPTELSLCEECQGKGYVIPLEKGCEIIHCDENAEIVSMRNLVDGSATFDYLGNDPLGRVGTAYVIPVDEIENLGKPITLQDVLLALRTKLSFPYPCEIKLFPKSFRITIRNDNGMKLFQIDYDLDLSPEDQTDETKKALIKILS